MPWQQHVADVGLEVDESGRLAYREVVVSVMRQNGKTTLVLAYECARCLAWGREQRGAYTGASGKEARSKFKEDHKPIIDGSPLSSLVRRFYMSDGGTSVVWKNGSRINVLDNSPSSGHGKTLDFALIDEAWADKDESREQALLPTMATRVDPQIWNTSTAGTQESAYLRRKVELGRAAVNSGRTDGVAYFEWSIPEDEDIDDPMVWENRMPAYGVTINEEFIRHARQTMTDGQFRRAIGNQWTETEERLIPAEYWEAVCAYDVRAGSDVHVVEAKPDRSMACIVKADTAGNVELVRADFGLAWVLKELEQLPRVPLVVDGYGPASVIADDFEKQGRQVVRKDSLEVRKACGRFYDAVADRQLRIRKHDLLDDAARNASRRFTADSWSWHREVRGGDALMGLSLAYAHAVKETWEPVASWM